MATGTLYRPAARNAHGDPVNDAGQVVRVGADGTEVGEIHGLVIGGPSWQPDRTARGTVSDTSGQVGVPVHSPVQPVQGDLLVVGGTRYRVGPTSWEHPNTLTGTQPRWVWFTVTAASN